MNNIYNPKGFSQVAIVILIILAVAIVGGGVFWFVSQQSQTNQNMNTVSNTNTGNANISNSNTTANINTTNQNTNTLINQNANTSDQNTNSAINQNANVAANTNSDPTADWRTYRNEEIGIEFKYPPEWGEVVLTFKTGVMKGEQFAGSISKEINKVNILFGGNSKDYQSAGGASFYDFYYFVHEKNSNYKIKFAEDKFDTVSASKVLTLSGGIEAIIIENQEIDQIFNNKDRVAYVNLMSNVSSFNGIAFRYRNAPIEEKEVFDQVISTIKYAK